MNILIKGMEMPENCHDCIVRNQGFSGDGMMCGKTGSVLSWHDGNRKRMDNCPLVPVPPHGDLIGREWLIDIAHHLMNTAKNDDIANGVKWLWQYIIDAPTIIEAEEDE